MSLSVTPSVLVDCSEYTLPVAVWRQLASVKEHDTIPHRSVNGNFLP